MTLEDLLAREAIRDTMAKYNHSGDSLRAEDFAACFTEDGILESARAGGFRYASRAEILAWQSAWRDEPKSADTPRGAKLVRHNLTTSRIELTGPDSARARTYWVVMTDVGPDHCGVYTDQFRKVDGEWLIAHRKVKTEWWAENSHFRAPTEG
ncbi:MAG: nuclear transport factor 2 family protein [Novosphingobium sp.]